MQIYAIRGRVSLSSQLWTYFQKSSCSEARGLSKKSEIKHKVLLPPIEPWSIAKSTFLPSALPHPPPPPSGLKDFCIGGGWVRVEVGCILNYLPYFENHRPLPSLSSFLSLSPSRSPFLLTSLPPNTTLTHPPF